MLNAPSMPGARSLRRTRRLARTINSINSTFERIGASSERERHDASDPSTRLQSPVATLWTEFELATRTPEPAERATVVKTASRDIERVDRLVEGLLLLARSDEGALPRATRPTDLADVVAAVVEKLTPPEATLVSERAEAPVPVDIPLVYLDCLVSNLVDNACRFARSRVAVTARASGREAILEVRDDGPGIPEADRQGVFERFAQLDAGPDRGEAGFGLGLSIVAAICRSYGGSIELRSGNPGAVFVARLPLAREPESR
jgi:signal transduction histidine kinase